MTKPTPAAAACAHASSALWTGYAMAREDAHKGNDPLARLARKAATAWSEAREDEAKWPAAERAERAIQAARRT